MTGRISELYNLHKVSLLILYLRPLSMLSFLLAFSKIFTIWAFHERFVVNFTPRCVLYVVRPQQFSCYQKINLDGGV
jgi:hypothetical protein